MRTAAHLDSHKLNGARTLCQSNQFTAAMSIVDFSICERLPIVFFVGVQMHRIVAEPVLDTISCGVRGSPMNSERVDQFWCAEIDHHPLRMSFVRFAGEMRIQIRITFPK